MRDSALAISGALYAHASIVADDELQAKTKLSKGYIDQKRDTDILYWAERISSLAAQHAAALLPMGIGAPLLANLATSVEAFRSNLSEPTERRSTANAALAKADMQVALIDKNLEIIDALMQAASLSHSQLYFEYQLDRKIIDNR